MSGQNTGDVGKLCHNTPTITVLDNRGLSVRGIGINRTAVDGERDICVTRHTYNAVGHLQSSIDELPLEDNLFDTEQWILWGLNRRQLTVAAALAGATTGAMVDAAVAGSSFMTGAVGGGLLGAGGAWFGAGVATLTSNVCGVDAPLESVAVVVV